MTHFNQIRKAYFPAVVLCLFSIIILMPADAHAGYLDPGANSSLVQWIVAGAAAVGKIKEKIVGMFKKSQK
ncbi:hypothetical protein [Desulfovibrio sp. JC022]|uniref:hypothetical protein n=1 Tax=Desulfovibrio sp. JC022 TaxID=2593642 RepID=UPI0013D16946|nr:hypothetical protein [Desulfovibrio sp. JC022]NDV23213.1 hypothetical protein [Desulfovibrio sp. JC022]